MEIKRAYKFRIYPNAEQIGRMRSWRASLRWLWNLALEQRMMGLSRPRDERRYPSFFDQNRELTDVRALDSRLDDVPSCCCQQVLRELDLAWKRCFQRIAKAPRFKGHRHEEHLRIYAPDVNGWKIRGDELTFRKLGPMRIVVDRPISIVIWHDSRTGRQVCSFWLSRTIHGSAVGKRWLRRSICECMLARLSWTRKRSRRLSVWAGGRRNVSDGAVG